MTNEELLAFVRKNPLGIGCGGLALLLGGAIYYRGDAVPEAEAELTQKTTESERLIANNKNATQLQEHFDALVGANKAIDARIVRSSQFAKNLQYFYKLESETGVKLTTDPRISPASAKKDPKAAFVSIPCNLSVQGNLTQLLGFLRRLESGTHYCRVQTVSIASAADRNASLNLSINLELLGLP
jgi:hypothetical protein